MPPLANQNNNPGDLNFAGQANATPTAPEGTGGNTFAQFPTPQDGYAALLNDIQAKITRSPNEDLADFANTYAPEDAGNNSAQYAADLANQLGVPPNTTIGSLEPDIGKFADAVAKNEGYQPSPGAGIGNTANAVGQAAGSAYNDVGGAPGVAALGGVGAAAGLLGGAEGLGEEALSGIEGLGSSAIGAVKGLFGGNQSSGSSAPQSPPQTPNLLGDAPPPQEPSKTYDDLSGALGSMIGGQQVMQEGKNRGIDPVQILEQSGASSVLQPDENGDYNKPAATQFLNNQIAQDKAGQTTMVQGMKTPVSLNEEQSRAESEIDAAMADTGERQSARKEVKRIFDDYRSEQPKDSQGNPSDFITPARLQKKRDLLSVNEKDFARPTHERSAATHIKESMRKSLSEGAKKEGVKGWDETNRRMEAMMLAKKAVKKLPKKAERNRGKEFRKDLAASVVGGLIGKTLGNGTLGTIAGHYMERQFGKKEYNSLGSKKEQQGAEIRSKQNPAISLAGIKPRKKKGESYNSQ